VNHPSWLPPKQVWPVYFVVVLAVIGLLTLVLHLVTDDDQKSRQKAVGSYIDTRGQQGPCRPVSAALMVAGTPLRSPPRRPTPRLPAGHLLVPPLPRPPVPWRYVSRSAVQ
jgi:hypothetical protein